jgi:calcineurin-like phosphoesterase family protein
MGMTSVLVVSDTHLSTRTPEALSNWDAVVRHASGSRPALVVHAGDVTADGVDRPDELGLARTALDRLGTPVWAVPGNHDVGEIPALGTPQTAVLGPGPGTARPGRSGSWGSRLGATSSYQNGGASPEPARRGPVRGSAARAGRGP